MPYLFPLPLRGIGTLNVEALSSYIYRLAIAHGVSAGRLLTHILSWYGADHPEAREGLSSIRSTGDLSIYIRPNHGTLQMVNLLTHTTGNDRLRCGTFLALQDALDRSVKVFSRRVRWCQACMAEFSRLDDPGYFKLLWHLKAVTHCPTHGVKLIDKCAKCGSHQGSVGVRHNCTSCCECDAPLSQGLDATEMAASWVNHGADLIELVETIASDPNLAYPTKGVQNVLSAIFDKVWADEQEQKFWSLIPKDECICIVTGHQPVSLTTARRLAFRLGMRLPDLLAGIADTTSGVLEPTWTEVLPAEMRPKKRRKPRDRSKLLKKLHDVLSVHEKTRPPALKTIAREMDVSVGCLHYHFPTQARDIIEHHRSWREERQQRLRLEARSAALAFFTNKKYALERKSRKRALRVLRVETELPKNLLRQEIATALHAIRSDPKIVSR